MSRGWQGQQGFTKRRPQLDPRELKAAWVAAIAEMEWLADATARQIGEDREPDYGQRLTRMTPRLRDLEATNFPVMADSARTQAAAFLALSRAFCHPAWSPEARTACAGFLKAGAQSLDVLVSTLRLAEAQHGRRILGERDED